MFSEIPCTYQPVYIDTRIDPNSQRYSYVTYLYYIVISTVDRLTVW